MGRENKVKGCRCKQRLKVCIYIYIYLNERTNIVGVKWHSW